MTWYPAQSQTPDTEPTSPCPILIMPSTWLGRNKDQFEKSLVWLDHGFEILISCMHAIPMLYRFRHRARVFFKGAGSITDYFFGPDVALVCLLSGFCVVGISHYVAVLSKVMTSYTKLSTSLPASTLLRLVVRHSTSRVDTACFTWQEYKERPEQLIKQVIKQLYKLWFIRVIPSVTR